MTEEAGLPLVLEEGHTRVAKMRRHRKHRHSDPRTGKLLKSYPFDVMTFDEPIVPALMPVHSPRRKEMILNQQNIPLLAARPGATGPKQTHRLYLMADSKDLRTQWLEQIDGALDDYHKVSHTITK